jgi:phosphoglycan beta-1,3-galactosyltransferase
VGMSQKLILWLSYAYHAFPNVPYIIKGDDDAYLKVPQYLSDIRYVRGGLKKRFNAFPDSGASASVLCPAVQADARYGVHNTECLYGGSLRRFRGCHFAAGMTFLISRHLIGVLLARTYAAGTVNNLRLATGDFTYAWRHLYLKQMFHHEDIMLGMWLKSRHTQASKVCLHGKVNYMWEGRGRFHDMHRGKVHNVTWSTVVAHRCSPADAYFLQHYFRNEYSLSNMSAVSLSFTVESPEAEVGTAPLGMSREEAAQALATKWAQTQKKRFAQDTRLRAVVGWDDMPSAVWTHATSATPLFAVAAVDRVAVYDVKYRRWMHQSSMVFDGFVARV